MMSGVSQKEYLKRYLQKDPDKKAKKKKKKHSAISSSTHLKRSVIIDDDVNLNDLPLGEDGQLDLEQLGDEAPQIVGIIDERPEIVKLEEKYKSGKWRPMGEEGGHTESKMGGDKRTYFEAGGDRHKQQDDTKRSDDSDLSPPRVNPKRAPDGKRRDTAPTKSNEREANGSDSDLEVPRRRRRNNSHSPASRDTKRHKDEKHQKSEDSDLSPPRRDRKDGSRDVSKIKSKNRDRLRRGSDSDIEVPRKTQNRGSDSDLSPPRHSRSGNSHGDKTSEKTERSSSRWDGSKKPSSFRGREVDSDQSPPRRGNGGEPRNRKGRGNSNFSPPRRHKDGRKADMTPPKRRKVDPEADLSPPRRRKDGRDADSSPPRRRKAEANLSPPRRRKDGRDAASSPPRRRKADPEADLSPPRRRKDGRDADSSLRRRKADPEADLSPPRRRKDGNDSDLSPPRKNKNTEDKRDRSNSDKMGDGKRAGLQDAKSLKDELRLLKEKEDEMFRKMDPELLGARSAAVVRDRKTGLKRDFEKEREIERKKSAKAAVRQKKYEKWGKGLKQIQEQEERVADMIHEMSKPLARYAGDDDLERALKAQEREGDPMLEYIKSHQKDSHTIDLTVGGVRKKYMGSFLPNRFNIAPGHRWDGVDRSNGYEQKWFAAKNAKQATAEEAWKWSSADM